MKAYLFVLLLCLAALPMAQAVQYGNVTVSSASSNTTVTFDQVADCDAVEPGDSYVLLTNCLFNSSAGAISSTMNFTATNNVTDSASFPQITASSGNVVTISNGLNFSVSVALNVSTNGIAVMTPWVLYPDGTAEAFDLTTGSTTLQITIGNLPPGMSILHVSSVCDLEGNAACQVGGGSGGSGSSVVNQSLQNTTVHNQSTNVTTNMTGEVTHLELTGESVDAQGRRNLIIVIVCVLFVVLMTFVLIGLSK